MEYTPILLYYKLLLMIIITKLGFYLPKKQNEKTGELSRRISPFSPHKYVFLIDVQISRLQ